MSSESDLVETRVESSRRADQLLLLDQLDNLSMRVAALEVIVDDLNQWIREKLKET